MHPRRLGAGPLALALMLGTAPAVAQIAGTLFVRPEFALYFPLSTYTVPLTGETKPLYSTVVAGGGIEPRLYGLALARALRPGGLRARRYTSSSALDSWEGDLGLGFQLRASDRIVLRLDAMGGIASITLRRRHAARP